MKNLIIIISAVFLLCAFSNYQPALNYNESNINNQKDMEPALIHTVYFWTKESTTEKQMKAFEEGLIKLGTCPQIAAYYWGPPAPTEARGVVDNSYQYAINVHFNSVEDEKAYQSEPIHLAFIEGHNAIWEKVIVYDNIIK